MNEFLAAAVGVGGSTLLGSLLGFLVKGVSHRLNDVIIGACAGVMLSASILGLLEPAFGMAPTWHQVWLPVLGVILGVLLLNFLDQVTPHLHALAGVDVHGHKADARQDRVLLFVAAIALHKLPEGLAAGVGYADVGASDALSVAVAISLQNIPEGMVIISPLLLAGVSPLRTFLLAATVAGLEVLGMYLGFVLGSLTSLILPLMLALSGGAMLYVVSVEMIPESHSHGYEKQATYALLAGFVLMLLLERI